MMPGHFIKGCHDSVDEGLRRRSRLTPADPQALPKARKLLIFGVMAFGQFMALLDIQIVAASLNDVQAGLSAGPDEIDWVQTGYLMAELVMIPFSPPSSPRPFPRHGSSPCRLASLHRGKRALRHGLGHQLDDPLPDHPGLRRRGHGADVVRHRVLMFYAARSRRQIPAVLGMVSVLAPTLSPTVGGWLTDAVGWRSIFDINILRGLLVTVLAMTVIRVDRPNLSMLKKIDYAHLAAMAVFLGGLE